MLLFKSLSHQATIVRQYFARLATGTGLLLLLGSLFPQISSASSAFPYTTGVQKTAVILVNFQDNTSQPIAPADANTLMFTTVNNYYKEASYQQASLTGSVFGWYTIAASQASCDTSVISSQADQAAAAAGVDLSSYKSIVYMFPRTNACTWDGYTVGFAPVRQFINGKFTLYTVGHEFGHGLGLQHAHGYDCDVNALGNNCVYLPYGDGADIMGGAAGHFNAFQKESLGWLNASGTPPITTVSATGSYSIDTIETAGTASKALKILKSIDPSSGARTWYYVEYRQAVGSDSVLANYPGLQGVQVRMATEGNGDSSFLLDMTPNSQSTYYDLNDAALPVGQSYTDSAAGITITTSWTNSASAGIYVIVGSATCSRTKPGVTLTGPTQSVAAGTAQTYTLTVNNNDSAGCGSSSFSLASSVPSGWSGNLSASSLNVAAGASASASVTVTSPASATSGSYSVSGNATSTVTSADTGSATATYSIGTATGTLAATVTTGQATYAAGSTVALNAKVSMSGTPVSGAKVTYTVTKPNGSQVVASSTSSSNGAASYSLRLNKTKDPTGTYQVRAVASSGSQTANSTTSFIVK